MGLNLKLMKKQRFLTEHSQRPYRQVWPLGSHLGNAFATVSKNTKKKDTLEINDLDTQSCTLVKLLLPSEIYSAIQET